MAIVIKTTITINKSVEKVWEAFMDPSNLPHWLTGFVSIKVLKGKQGEIGSQNEVVFIEHGKEMLFTETVMLITPMQQSRFAMEHKTMSSENDFRFISFGHYTEIIQTIQIFPKSFLLKLMLPLIKGSLKKKMTKDLSNLKKLIEENKKMR